MSLLFTIQLKVLPSTQFCKIRLTTTSSWALYIELMLGVPQGDTDLPDLQEGRGCWYQQQKLAHNSFNLKCHELHVYILVGTLFATLAVKTNNAPPCPPPPGQAGTGQISRPEDGDTDCDGYKITSTLLAEPITLDMEKTLSSRQLELLLHVLTTGKSHLGEPHLLRVKRPVHGCLKQMLLWQTGQWPPGLYDMAHLLQKLWTLQKMQ